MRWYSRPLTFFALAALVILLPIGYRFISLFSVANDLSSVALAMGSDQVDVLGATLNLIGRSFEAERAYYLIPLMIGVMLVGVGLIRLVLLKTAPPLPAHTHPDS